MSEQPKRIVVDCTDITEFEAKVNALADYTMEHFQYSPGKYVAVMKLKSDPTADFSGSEDLMEVPIDKVSGVDSPLGTPLIAKVLKEGWRIIGTYKGTKDTPSTAMMVKKP